MKALKGHLRFFFLNRLDFFCVCVIFPIIRKNRISVIGVNGINAICQKHRRLAELRTLNRIVTMDGRHGVTLSFACLFELLSMLSSDLHRNLLANSIRTSRDRIQLKTKNTTFTTGK